tara:strand:- start:242 stop:739 length:498 start_codon:yes stop_codon:yes gene_type:complete
MSEYRNRTTGEVKTQGQWRAANPNMSLPRTWKAATLDALNLDPVLRSPAATTGAYQSSVRDGVEQDSNGNWVEKYVARDMFSDTTEDGVTTTKAEHEAAYQAALDAAEAERNRTKRDGLLAETDYFALTDVTMDAAMTTYRQALRDITAHENFPRLEDADWPTKP